MSEPVTYEVERLEGALLDQAVACACKFHNRMHLVPAPIHCEMKDYRGWITFAPSTDGAQGLDIIEQHRLELIPQAFVLQRDDGRTDTSWCALAGPPGSAQRVLAYGSTALVAAMRALVKFEFGETITLPGILP